MGLKGIAAVHTKRKRLDSRRYSINFHRCIATSDVSNPSIIPEAKHCSETYEHCSASEKQRNKNLGVIQDEALQRITITLQWSNATFNI